METNAESLKETPKINKESQRNAKKFAKMDEKVKKIYEFEDFQFDVTEQILLRGGEVAALTPKVFDLLAILVENHGHLLTKDELIKTLWADSFVEEANLNVTVSALRKVLGETPNEHRFIETVPRRGYRFVAEVREIADETIQNTDQNFTEAKTLSIETPAKKCPHCRKVYYDETLNFCLDDGETLTAETHPTKKTFSIQFQNRSKLFLLFGGILLAATAGIFVWKYSFQIDKTGVSNIRTIAVLPFKPLTNNQSDDALEIGMADALITKLGSIGQIMVRPTSAVSKYSKTNTDPLAAGRELRVEAVLDGKIQRADNKIRVTVHLLRVSDGATLWAETFDDYFTNIFAVQDSISEKIAERLSIRLTKAEEETITKRQTENSEAYRLFLQGVFHHNKASPDELKKALNFYQQAIEKDSEYSLPHSASAEIYQSLANFNIESEVNNRKAIESVDKAISLDSNSAEAYTALGRIKLYVEWDFAEGEKAYRRAVELKPNDAAIRHAYSFYFSMLRRHNEAIREMKKAIELDPVSVYINNDFVRILMNARRLDEALEQAKKAVELDSRYVFSHRNLALVYSAKEMHQEAIEEIQKEAELGGLKKVSSGAGYIYARAGKRAEAEKILRDYQQSLDQVGVNHLNIAQIYVSLGEKEKAIEWIEKSFEKREPVLLAIYAYPEWDELRSDPRFQELIKKLGFPR